MIQAYRKQYGCDFISVMPSNMYGPNDNYHPKNSHVLAALVKKFVEAKEKKLKKVEVWGTGKPLREFLHVSDFAKAILFSLEKYSDKDPINVGSGEEISIIDLASKISKLCNYKGTIVFNNKYPDGTFRKVLDSKKIHKLGWKAKIKLNKGLKQVIDLYKFS